MNRATALLCALLALTTSACVFREKQDATTPAVDPNSSAMDAGASDQRLGTASYRVYDPTNGESLVLKTVAVDGGSALAVSVENSTGTGALPATGQATMANSLPVVVASNQSAIPVSGTLAAVTSVTNAVNIKPSIVAATAYWTAQSSAATLTGSALDTTGYRSVCFDFTLANTSTPVGTFEIDSSVDGTNNWGAIYLDANKPTIYIGTLVVANLQTFSGGYSYAISSPSGTVTFSACIEATKPFVRLVYTRTSGGAVSTIGATYTLRSN